MYQIFFFSPISYFEKSLYPYVIWTLSLRRAASTIRANNLVWKLREGERERDSK